jgi:hypothetical protein
VPKLTGKTEALDLLPFEADLNTGKTDKKQLGGKGDGADNNTLRW